MRQVVLDTETTGLSPQQGHRVIEIGCVELVNRRLTGNHYHCYINPGREVALGAIEVHGITNEFLADKPPFADVVDPFIDYVQGAELIIHNAPFDVGFLNHELRLTQTHDQTINDLCTVFDSLVFARQKHPGQHNSLDALCKRYGIDLSKRTLHGALLDAELLAEVYLGMTGGQTSLFGQDPAGGRATERALPLAQAAVTADRPALKVIRPSAEEEALHRQRLKAIHQASGGRCEWEYE